MFLLGNAVAVDIHIMLYPREGSPTTDFELHVRL